MHERIKEKLNGLKNFNYKLFFALCAAGLVPAIYQTVKTSLLSSNHSSDVFDIIGQMEWFDLINETLLAFLIVPLYSVLNKILKNDPERFPAYTFKTGLLAFFLYALFSVGVLIYGSALIGAMNPNETDTAQTTRYLRLETIAFMIGVIVSLVNVVFIVTGKSKNVYIFLGIGTLLSVLSDTLLIPRCGVYGVAVSNILVNAVLSVSGVILIKKQHCIKICGFYKDDLSVLKGWLKTGVFSGMQQFIDNLIYAVMICKMVNAVSEQGNYWIANNFIWGWLLIPVTALSEIIRRDCKDGYKNLRRFNYFFIGGAIVVLWACSVCLWKPFFACAERLSNADEIFLITVKLAPFYIAYIGCAIIDNIFIGLGKTQYNAINSALINFVYYGIFYILYRTGVLTFSMNVIILMFGFGMAVHFFVSLAEERLFLQRQESNR